MAGGYRSQFGFWFGGFEAPPPPATTAGYRSQFGFWFGGFSAPSGGAAAAGWRSLFLRWLGGNVGAGSSGHVDWIVRARRRNRR
jgi:hypothetical protein